MNRAEQTDSASEPETMGSKDSGIEGALDVYKCIMYTNSLIICDWKGFIICDDRLILCSLTSFFLTAVKLVSTEII